MSNSGANLARAFGAFAAGDTTTPQTWTGVNWAQGKLWKGNANNSSFSSKIRPDTTSDDVRSKFIEWFGQGGTVPGTPQAMAVQAKYFNRTTEDSAQGNSSLSMLVDTGTGFTQTFPVTGDEGDVIVAGANFLNNKGIGVAAAVEAQQTGHIASAFPFYASAKAARDAGTLVDLWCGFYAEDPATGSAGTITDRIGVYSKPRMQTETGLIIGITQAATSAAAKATPLYVIGPASLAQPTAVFQQASGQTSLLVDIRNTSAQTMAGWNSNGQLGMKTGAGSYSFGSAVGPMIAIGNLTTAPSANFTGGNGGFLYVESGALKFRGGTGTVTVVAAA